MKLILEEIESIKSKEDAIKLICELFEKNKIANKSYYDAILKREKQASFYMGNYLAIPHGVRQKNDVIESGIVILRTKKPISWDSNDVHYVVGIASKDDDHLEMIMNIAIQFDDEKKVLKSLKTPLDKFASEAGWN